MNYYAAFNRTQINTENTDKNQRSSLHRLSSVINDLHSSLAEIKSIVPLIVSTTRALAYLKSQLPDATALDWDAALDELGQEWGWDL